MKTYFYRPVGMRYDPNLRKLKDPITLCESCRWQERGNIVVTTKHRPKTHCDKCGG